MDVGAKGWLTAEEDQALRARSNGMGFYLVLHAWLTIFLAMALYVAWPNPLTFLLAVVLIGGRQLGLAILMHDAAHRLLFKNTRLNDWLGFYLCGSPVGASLALYRPYHLQHHRHTQQKDDPDWILSAPFPISQKSFVRKMLRDFFGVTAFQRRLEGFRYNMGEGTTAQRRARLWRVDGHFLVANGLLFLLLWGVGHPELFFSLWLLPLMTWYQVISRIRNIAEHAVVPDNDDPLRNTRTTLTNLAMRAVLAPYWVNYHLEHHLLVATPCWKLPAAHRLLCARGLRDRMEVVQGYRAVLRQAISNPHDGPHRGRERKVSMI